MIEVVKGKKAKKLGVCQVVLKGRIGGKGRYLQVAGGSRTFSKLLHVYHDHDHDVLISFVLCFFFPTSDAGEAVSGKEFFFPTSDAGEAVSGKEYFFQHRAKIARRGGFEL